MRGFIEELKRRNVAKVALVYIIAGWLTMQVVDVMFPALHLPEWLISAVAAFVLIGFPFALIFAWAFEMTPDGLKREKDVDRSESITPQTGQKLNHTAMVILAIAVAFLLVDKFVLQADSGQVDTPTEIAISEEKPSIAVLPFVNMSGDIENEYFSDGLSEELLNLLAKIPQLHVAGRTSSFKFKDTNEDLRIIGEALNVAHVLEGSVRKSGVRLRITAQLIDTQNGYHLWSENYDRELTDIFAIQDEIAGHVVEELRVHLLGAELASSTQGTANIEAYNQFLRGNYFSDRTSPEDLAKAIAAFEAAIKLDPEFARAYAALAMAQQMVFGGWTASSGGNFIDNFETMRETARIGVQLAPDDAETLMAWGMVAATADWDVPRALESSTRAIEVGPNNVSALAAHGANLLFFGRFEEAENFLKHALELDPLSLNTFRSLGDVYMTSGRFDKSIEAYEQALGLDPESGRLYGRIARARLFQGDLESAREFNAKEPVDWARETNEIIFLGRDGSTEDWQAAVTTYEEQYGFGNSYQMAEIYADKGDLDKTFEWLDHTARVKDPGGPWALIMPFFDEAKKDPRWRGYEEKFGL
jgi:TolB-like protein/Flp pilus assembly protein TadD